MSATPSADGLHSSRPSRERAFLNARITYADGALTAPVTVVQISATGARVMIDDGVTLPERFQLQIPRKNIDGPARLVWRRNGFAGVAFGAERENAPFVVSEAAPENLRQRIAELERENSKLRAQFAQANAMLSRLTDGF